MNCFENDEHNLFSVFSPLALTPAHVMVIVLKRGKRLPAYLTLPSVGGGRGRGREGGLQRKKMFGKEKGGS